MRFAALKTAWLSLFALLVLAGPVSSFAQENPPKKKNAEPAGRLPAYYKDVVDEAQRKKIYEIQAKYKVKIEVLSEEVKSLQAQQNKEIEALLSPEQKEKLAKVKAEADKKKAATAAAIKATEEAKPASPASATTPAATVVPKSAVPATTLVPAGPAPATVPRPVTK